MFEYDIATMLAAQKLDEYDLSKALNECVSNRWFDVGTIYEWIGTKSHPELEEILGEFSLYEFACYLAEKYHVRFDEVTAYYIYPDGPIQKQ